MVGGPHAGALPPSTLPDTKGARKSFSLAQPIRAGETVDSGELPLIVGNHGIAERNDLSCDEKIVATDRRTGLLEARTERAINGIGGGLERQNVKCTDVLPYA